MQNRSVVAFSMLASLAMFACGGAAAQSAESARDPWSDFKGTYSQPAAPRAEKTEKGDTAKKSAEAKAKAEPKEATEEAAALPPAPKKSSKGTVKGESLSSISVDALTDATKGTLKNKFVSNSVVSGPQYEIVNVQLKGASVQITRPASSPQANGPAVTAPSTKKGELSKNDASWYDEEADVLVVVTSGKKAAAQKTLTTLVKH